MPSTMMFCVFAFFLTNISSRAPRAIGMMVPDGDGRRQNMQYCIGFIDSRDGRAEGTFSITNALIAHTRRRHGAGQTWHFLRRFIGGGACTSIRRIAIRDAETRLSLRFPWFMGRPTLSTYTRAAKRPEAAKT